MKIKPFKRESLHHQSSKARRQPSNRNGDAADHRHSKRRRLELNGDGPQDASYESDRNHDLASNASDELQVSSSDSEADAEESQRPYTALLRALGGQTRANGVRARIHGLSEALSSDLKDRPSDDVTREVIEQPDQPTERRRPDSEDLEQERPSDDNDDGNDDDDNDTEDDLNDESHKADPFETHLADDRLEAFESEIAKENGGLAWDRNTVPSISGWRHILFTPRNIQDSELDSSSAVPSLDNLYLKEKLKRSFATHFAKFDAGAKSLATHLFGYRDVLYLDRTPANGGDLRCLASVHALNHLLKTRNKVIKDNARLVKAKDKGGDEDGEGPELRDQGFTRPKVLFLLPTRQACVRLVDTLIAFLEPEQQENKKRFHDAFSRPDDLAASDKADDFKELFSGNDDDRFLMGLKITRKTVRFFSSFYNADMIIASPLALHAKITHAGNKKPDFDFLSSVELVIVDQADALLMQNWDNVQVILDHLNLQPKEAHGCDIARIRRWYLDGRAKNYRQTIILSAYNFPELNRLFDRSLCNLDGKVKVDRSNRDGVLPTLGVQAKQTFVRFNPTSPLDEPDLRFRHFTSSIMPLLSKYAKSRSGDESSGLTDRLTGTLIFVPSYMDFLRLQNFFTYSTDLHGLAFDPADMPCISEYASKSSNARAKSLFQTGRHPVLLYTGRAHHFYRYKLGGARRLIMYALPDNPVFYHELVSGYLSRSVSEGRFGPEDLSVHVLFSKFDIMKLERITGSKRAVAMVKEKGDIFEFF